MKKILSILGTISLITTSGSINLMACKKNIDQKTKETANKSNDKSENSW